MAGVIVAVASPGWAILADALSYVVSVASLAALRMGPAPQSTPESFFAQLHRGWSEFWARTWLWSIVLSASLFNLVAIAPYFVFGAVIAKESLGGATAWGTILAAQGAGAVLGGITMLRVHIKRPLVAGGLSLLVRPFPLLALAYVAPVPVIASGAFLGGASFAVFDTQWQTTMQREVPAEVLSRVSAYDWFGSLVFLPVGYAIAGPVASVVGIRTVFFAGTACMCAAVAALMLVPSIRHMRAGT